MSLRPPASPDLSAALSRRNFLSAAAALGLLGATGGALLDPSTAAAAGVRRDARPTIRDALLRRRDGLSDGFRPAVQARLTVLEQDAGLSVITRDGERWRDWTKARLRRLEQHRILDPGSNDGNSTDDDDSGRVWRERTIERVQALERFLPASLRAPFYTHLPLDVPPLEYGSFLRSRIAEGSCNGVFVYMGTGSPMGMTGWMESIVESGPPCPILLSPKNVSDPVRLNGFMDYFAERPEWLPYVRVAYWQEFQGDFGGSGQPPISQWHDAVNTLADAADRVGIQSIAHAETWNLHPSQPHGGIPRLLEFLRPVMHRLGGGITWSVFIFGESESEGPASVLRMRDFMAEYFPWTSHGVGAYGDSVPADTPPADERRVKRASRVARTTRELAGLNALYGGYYALPNPPNPARDFWDDIVKEEIIAAVREHEQRPPR